MRPQTETIYCLHGRCSRPGFLTPAYLPRRPGCLKEWLAVLPGNLYDFSYLFLFGVLRVNVWRPEPRPFQRPVLITQYPERRHLWETRLHPASGAERWRKSPSPIIDGDYRSGPPKPSSAHPILCDIHTIPFVWTICVNSHSVHFRHKTGFQPGKTFPTNQHNASTAFSVSVPIITNWKAVADADKIALSVGTYTCRNWIKNSTPLWWVCRSKSQ